MTTTLRYLTALGLVAVLAISLLGFLPGWPDDMLTPFRPQLLAAAVLGLGVSATLKARWLIGLAAAIALVVALPMATRLIERPVLPARPAAQNITSRSNGWPCNGRRPVQLGIAVSRNPVITAET